MKKFIVMCVVGLLMTVCMANVEVKCEEYVYDEFSRLVCVIYENGDRIEYEYDNNGNIIRSHAEIKNKKDKSETEDNPGQETEENSDQDPVDNPSQDSEDDPGQGMKENPDEEPEDNPGQGMKENPDEDSEDNPGQGTKDKPDQETEDNPGQKAEENSDQGEEDNLGTNSENNDSNQGESVENQKYDNIDSNEVLEDNVHKHLTITQKEVEKLISVAINSLQKQPLGINNKVFEQTISKSIINLFEITERTTKLIKSYKLATIRSMQTVLEKIKNSIVYSINKRMFINR